VLPDAGGILQKVGGRDGVGFLCVVINIRMACGYEGVLVVDCWKFLSKYFV